MPDLFLKTRSIGHHLSDHAHQFVKARKIHSNQIRWRRREGGPDNIRYTFVGRQHNNAAQSELRTAIKKVRKAIAGGDKAAAQAALDASRSTIDAMARKGMFHRNTAARHKSRLQTAIKALP